MFDCLAVAVELVDVDADDPRITRVIVEEIRKFIAPIHSRQRR